MIHSLFIISSSGEILIEKHWRGLVSRTIGEQFWTEVTNAGSPEEVPPVIVLPRHYLFPVYRYGFFFVGVLHSEAPPLMVVELLHRIIDIFADYFGGFTEELLKENFVTIYQLLDELVDNGLPMTTEPNILKELVAPPTLMNKVRGAISGAEAVSAALPDSSLSAVPWRKTGIRYANNEVFFDIIEELDCIIDAGGMVVSSEVNGSISCNCRLTGMPDVLLTFTDPSLIEDCSFHPCVRYARYQQDKALSFIPPDGQFQLVSYRVNAHVQPPISLRPQFMLDARGGTINLTVSAKPVTVIGASSSSSSSSAGSSLLSSSSMSSSSSSSASSFHNQGASSASGRALEDVVITIPFPKNVDAVNCTVSQGFVRLDQLTKELRWEVGRLNTNSRSPTLTGTVVMGPVPSESGASSSSASSSSSQMTPSCLVSFKLPMVAFSGLKVDSVTVTGERYKPYKGVRSFSKSGNYQVRSQ